MCFSSHNDCSRTDSTHWICQIPGCLSYRTNCGASGSFAGSTRPEIGGGASLRCHRCCSCDAWSFCRIGSCSLSAGAAGSGACCLGHSRCCCYCCIGFPCHALVFRHCGHYYRCYVNGQNDLNDCVCGNCCGQND